MGLGSYLLIGFWWRDPANGRAARKAFLVTRIGDTLLLAPAAELAVAVVGAATLLLAGFAALAQTDIKRILAYSTMSQIGYMFLALGVGAWRAALFHLMTHTFFKALLFLSAGAITMRLHHEQNIFKMGGLARRLPAAFWSFLIGSAALAALPLVTAGFYSKEAILSGAWADGSSGRVLWVAGVVGACMTGLYIFRAVFIVFFGEAHSHVTGRYGWRILLPLTVLSALSILGGLIELPPAFGHVTLLSNLLAPVLPAVVDVTDVTPLLLASLAGVAGIALAALFYWRPTRPPAETALWRFWHAAAGFDWLYDRLLVRPVLWAARAGSADVVDRGYDGIVWVTRALHREVRHSQNGRIRWYTASLALGSISLIAIVVLR